MFYRYLFVPNVRTSETIKKYLRHVQRLSHTIKNIPMNNFVHGGLIKSFRNKSLQLDVIQMVTASSSLVNIDSTVQYGQYGGCTVPVRYGTVRYNNASPRRITKNRNNVCSNIRDIHICQISFHICPCCPIDHRAAMAMLIFSSC